MSVVCTAILPTASADYCSPNVHFGQIERIFFTRPGDGLTDVSSLSEWNTRLDQDDALPSPPTLAKIRYLYVIGDLPEADQTEIEISGKRKVYNVPEHTINFSVDDTDDTNLALALAVQQNGVGIFQTWFLAGGRLYGGNDGIETNMKINLVIPESKDEVQKLVGTMTWEGYVPQAVDSPFS